MLIFFIQNVSEFSCKKSYSTDPTTSSFITKISRITQFPWTVDYLHSTVMSWGWNHLEFFCWGGRILTYFFCKLFFTSSFASFWISFSISWVSIFNFSHFFASWETLLNCFCLSETAVVPSILINLSWNILVQFYNVGA